MQPSATASTPERSTVYSPKLLEILPLRSSPAATDCFCSPKLLEQHSDLSRAKSRSLRVLLANAAKCEPDKQGRFLIPTKLREQAGLVKDVVLVGVLTKIELWSKERWDESNCFGDMDDIAEHMAEHGINF